MTYDDEQLETRLRAIALPALSQAARSRLLKDLDAIRTDAAAVPRARLPIARIQARRPAVALAVSGTVLALCAAALLSPRVFDDIAGGSADQQVTSSRAEAMDGKSPADGSPGSNGRQKPPGDLIARRGTVGPGRRMLIEKSLAQHVNQAAVIVVGRAFKSGPAPVRPGSPGEYLISFRLKRVLKGKFVEKVFSTQTPTVPNEFIGKDWVVMLSPAYIAKQHRYGGVFHIKFEPRVKEIVSGNR